jgi:DNA invertase Pin-like site-specific DNA recombinase
MSTDRQEDSIERQRSQVEPYAARNGLVIVREYIDEGIAGDEERRRKAFQDMLRDAGRGDFRAILCDDKDRFGRFDSITYGYYVKPLRDAGICLETVAQGRIDWSSFSGRITDAILQEAKKVESQATSRRVMTRMLMMAKEGKYLGGPVPYGYRLATDPKFGKRLVPGAPDKVHVVQLVFRLYGEKGLSLHAISRELHERGFEDPRGRPVWGKATLAKMLGNRKYVGDMTWNVGHCGKYSELTAGQVKTSDAKIPLRKNAARDWVIVPDVHEPLIDRALFELVQERRVGKKESAGPNGDGGRFLLTGLLVCGRCGYRMVGLTTMGRPYYRCGLYNQAGRHGCGSNMIMERKLLACIVRKLQETFLDPGNLQALRDEMRRLAETAKRERPARTASLQRRIGEWDAKLKQGMERLPLIPADLMAEYTAMLRSWREDRDRLTAELRSLAAPPDPADLENQLGALKAQLSRLHEALAEAEPGLLRQLIREFVSKVELHFDQRRTRRQLRTTFRSGLIYVRPQEGLKLLTNTAARRSTSSSSRS